jgi:C4-dicarboxylate transporter DctM subunit
MSNPTAVGLAMFAGMLALMALRIPIAAAMFIPGAVGYLVMSGATRCSTCSRAVRWRG